MLLVLFRDDELCFVKLDFAHARDGKLTGSRDLMVKVRGGGNSRDARAETRESGSFVSIALSLEDSFVFDVPVYIFPHISEFFHLHR